MSKQGHEITPEHHAMLFAWVARAMMDRAGEGEGERVMRAAVRRYGRERGARMAARVRADGHPLTVAAYFGYGEWRADPATMSQAVTPEGENLRLLVEVCPWYTAWQAAGLIDCGRLYCLEIDRALMAGFSPDLVLEAVGTRPNGDDCCDFLFHGGLGAPEVVRPERDVVMPWRYHLGHLYWTLRDVILTELGAKGEPALQGALATFGEAYGEAAVEAILAFRETDFTRPLSPDEV